jgi:hypothetical protein
MGSSQPRGSELPARHRFGLAKLKPASHRALPATNPRDFVEQNGLGQAVSLARCVAAEHFGSRLTGFRESLGVTEAAEQYVEVEVGISVPRNSFVAARAEFLRAFRASGVEYDPDRLLISVRMRAAAD